MSCLFYSLFCSIFNSILSFAAWGQICQESRHQWDERCVWYVRSLDLAPHGISQTWSCQYTSSWLWPESICVFGGLLVMTDWWAGFVNSTDWVITRKCSEQALIGPRLWNFRRHWLGKAPWMILRCEVVIGVMRATSNTWSSVKWHACAHMYFGFVDCQHGCYNCCSAIVSLIRCLPEHAHILGHLKHKWDNDSINHVEMTSVAWTRSLPPTPLCLSGVHWLIKVR